MGLALSTKYLLNSVISVHQWWDFVFHKSGTPAANSGVPE